jgi:hypothetical protein
LIDIGRSWASNEFSALPQVPRKANWEVSWCDPSHTHPNEDRDDSWPSSSATRSWLLLQSQPHCCAKRDPATAASIVHEVGTLVYINCSVQQEVACLSCNIVTETSQARLVRPPSRAAPLLAVGRKFTPGCPHPSSAYYWLQTILQQLVHRLSSTIWTVWCLVNILTLTTTGVFQQHGNLLCCATPEWAQPKWSQSSQHQKN